MSPIRNFPELTERDLSRIKKVDKADRIGVKIGFYYNKLLPHQKDRFNRIVGSLTRKLGIHQYKRPIEMILIRFIALNVIRIERAMLDIMEGREDEYISAAEGMMLKWQKELRESLELLSAIVKVEKKKDKVKTFDDLRDVLRESEGLPKTEKTEIQKGGQQRRHYDDIVRTKSA